MIKRLKKYFLLVSILFSLCVPILSTAHPIDISSTTLSYHTNIINATSYIHSFEIFWLLWQQWVKADGVEYFYTEQDRIKEYIRDNISITNNDEICVLWNILIPEKEPYKIISEWLELNYSFTCEQQLDQVSIAIAFFLDFPLQTNRLTLYNLWRWLQNIQPIAYKVLNNKVTFVEYDVPNLDSYETVDTDWDWLSDEDEKTYKSDPLVRDTDNDGYSDYEEVYNSRDPVNPDPWPWQAYMIWDMSDGTQTWMIFDAPPVVDTTTQTDTQTQSNLDQTWLWAWTFGRSRLQKALSFINEYANGDTSNFWYMFGIVVFLGIIHAMWPWHAKNILISYILDKKKSLWHGILFAWIFSVTHLLDIVLLFVITTVFFEFVDPSVYMWYVQIGSVFVLFTISLWLARRAYKYRKNPNTDTSKEKKTNTKTTLRLSVISWLTPCTFGRSIFLLLLWLGRLDLVFPLIWGLWLWIFLFLLVLVCVTIFLRNRVYDKVSALARRSPLVSAIFMLIISIGLMIDLLW